MPPKNQTCLALNVMPQVLVDVISESYSNGVYCTIYCMKLSLRSQHPPTGSTLLRGHHPGGLRGSRASPDGRRL